MTQDIEAHDLFCGAGGTTTGFVRAGGIVSVAANHSKIAIETHNTNHPTVDHRLTDISQTDPRSFPPADVLFASPECTNHTGAKSHKARQTLWNRDDPKLQARLAAEERSRATMFDVIRFSEYHRYRVAIIENVVEIRKWELFDDWIRTMRTLGYEHQAVYLNSMVAFPTPQSRDRMYVVFWRRGDPKPDLEIRPKAWCAVHGDVEAIQTWKNPLRPWGKYRAQYTYRCPNCDGLALPYAWPAASAIDWEIPAPRIGDRKRPLATATLARIEAARERYGFGAIVQGGHTYERPGYYRTWPLWEPLTTQTGTIQHGIVIDTAYAHSEHASKVRDAVEPLPTQTGQQSLAMVVPMREHGHARPIEIGPLDTQVATASVHALLTMRGTHPTAIANSVHPLGAPVGTVSAGGIHHALLLRNYSGGAEMAKPIDAPAGTITTRDHHALLVDYHGDGKPPRSTDEPHRTMDSRDRYGLIDPAFDINDCGFRMLEPHEIKLAMAFPADYVILGNKREQVLQAGNAVTPPVSALLGERAVFATLGRGAGA
jgi:DNA (cytosine-5)-methyltransferase 1